MSLVLLLTLLLRKKTGRNTSDVPWKSTSPSPPPKTVALQIIKLSLLLVSCHGWRVAKTHRKAEVLVIWKSNLLSHPFPSTDKFVVLKRAYTGRRCTRTHGMYGKWCTSVLLADCTAAYRAGTLKFAKWNFTFNSLSLCFCYFPYNRCF